MSAMRNAWATLSLLAMLAVSAGFLGCANEVGDIDRTQSIVLEKSKFAGVWYYVRTVVDVPFSTSVSFQAETNTTSMEGTGKIVFDVQENLLIAYPIYEKVDGVEAPHKRRSFRKYWDPDAAKRGESEFIELYVGQPIAAWTISSHFDVIYDYSPATGASSNVIVENTSDKPWWERRFMRVDWNAEQLGDITFVTGRVNASSMQFVEEQEQSPLNPDAPEIYEDYIGVVTHYHVEPNAAGCSVWGLGRTDCAAAKIKVRHAFRKANPSEDAVVRPYTNREHMDKFGYFLADRYDFDPLYGYTDAGRDFKAQLWNLWQVSQRWDDHLDKHGNTISCLTQVDCPSGTRCMASKWFEDGMCKVGTPLPYAERGHRPIIFHLSHSTPGITGTVPVLSDEGALQAYEDPKDGQQYPLYEGGRVLMNSETNLPHPFVIESYEAADEWSKPFKSTVAWLLYHEGAGNLHVEHKAEGARGCTTHDDCISTNPHILADHLADTSRGGEFTCSPGAGMCPSDFTCTTLTGCDSSNGICNLCVRPRACSANQPCSLGSSCDGEGFCRHADGTQDYIVATGINPRSYTFVAQAGANGEVQVSRLTDILLPPGTNQPTLASSNQALVRFVNAQPGSTVSFRAVTADPADSTTDSQLQMDTIFQNVQPSPSSRSEEERMLGYEKARYVDDFFPYATRSAVNKWRRVEVLSGGQVVATLYNVSLTPGNHYLFVYADGEIIVAENGPSARGVRAINAVPASQRASLDFGLDSLVLGRQVPFGTVLPHRRPIVEAVNRFLILEAGARGDVVCYDDNTIGKCVGWGALYDDAAKEAVAKIESELPEMFVLCEPLYHGDDCSDEEMGNLAVYNDCRYSKRNEDGTISNPCKDLVPAPFSLKKLGDIRYNPFYWIEKAQAASPLGYGPSAADPEFGNTFYGIANMYGAPVYTIGRYSADILELINGTLDTESLWTGSYIREHILSRKEEFPHPSTLESAFEGLMMGNTLSGAQVAQGDPTGFVPLQMPPVLGGLFDRVPKAQATTYRDFTRTIAQQDMVPRFLPSHHPLAAGDRSARMAMLRGTGVADLLLHDEVLLAASHGQNTPGSMVSEDALDGILATVLDPDRYARLEAQRLQILARHNIYMAEFTDDAVVGIVMELGCTTEKKEQGFTEITSFVHAMRELERKRAEIGKAELEPSDMVCFSGEALQMVVTGRMYGGVLEHEIGHTVGLRHNFASSSDVFNFWDEWYDIRERERVYCYESSSCDDARGEFCALGCQTDADCPLVASCEFVEGASVCVDLRDARRDFVGWCMKPADVGPTESFCQFNAGASAPGTQVRVWDAGEERCFEQRYCLRNVHCGLGQRCQDNFCVSQATGETVRTAAVFTGCTADSDCGAGNLCGTGELEPGGTPQCLSYSMAIVPRAKMTAAEAAAKRVEYQDSSVMDYGQKINSQFHGLGKYDHAAIKFGYGDLVEVYQDTSYIDEFVQGELANGTTNSSVSFMSRPSSWGRSLNHPFRFLNHVLGPENAGSHNRITVPYQQVKLEQEMQWDYLNRELNVTYREVPYEFCSDEFRGNRSCYIWDAGVDEIEIVEHSMDMLRSYYLFDAFKRDRYAFGWGTAGLSYYARIRDRWMQPMRNAGLYAALYAFFFSGDSAYRNFWERFSKEPLGAIHFGESSRMAFQYLYQLVASPAPGSYQLDPDTNTYINVSYEVGKVAGGLNIPLGEGKYPYTTFDQTYGYHMFNHPLFVGSYWEKLAAISVLTENDVTFLSDYVGQDLDIGIKSAIGFTSIYPTPIVNLFGGIIADAPEYWAGVVVPGGDGSLTYRPRRALNPQLDDGWPVVWPSLSNLSFKALAGVFALSQVPAAFDTSITDSMGVVLRGHKSEYLLSEGLEWNEFQDPFGMKTYLALQPRYDDTRISAAWIIIDRANDLKEAWLNAQSTAEAAALAQELQNTIDVLNLLRELTDVYGILEI